jgi:hypothetical protein
MALIHWTWCRGGAHAVELSAEALGLGWAQGHRHRHRIVACRLGQSRKDTEGIDTDRWSVQILPGCVSVRLISSHGQMGTVLIVMQRHHCRRPSPDPFSQTLTVLLVHDVCLIVSWKATSATTMRRGIRLAQ